MEVLYPPRMMASAAAAPTTSARNRRYKRAGAPDNLQIAWQCPGVREVCAGTGLSQSGIFLNSPTPQPVGTTIRMKIPNPGGDIPVGGIVRSSTEAGMGVEFAAVGAKERAKLDLMVKRIVLAAQQQGEPERKEPSAAASLAAAEEAFSEAAAKKRRFIRINLPRGLKVAWTYGEQKELTIAGTIGLGGLFVISEKPAPVGGTVRLLFDIPGGTVLATAQVRSVAPKRGMGVEFTEIRPEDRARLDQLLKRLLS